MKAILMSVQPKWVSKILSGEKTIEIRKTAPKCKLPIEVYIYCTKGKPLLIKLFDRLKKAFRYTLSNRNTNVWDTEDIMCGKIVAKFTLNKINKIDNKGNRFTIGNDDGYTERIAKQSCLIYADLRDYAKEKNLYAWHIADLVVFDKPMELSEFETQCEYDKKPTQQIDKNCSQCVNFENFDFLPIMCRSNGRLKLTRPPQSWQYVEKL